jgi:hypothetical protein
MRSALQEAGSAQGVCNGCIILTNLTGYRTRSLLCQDAQAKLHERLGDIWFVGMGHNPELMRP